MERRYLCLPTQPVQLQSRDGSDLPSRIVGHAAVFFDGSPGTEYELWPGLRERIMPSAFVRAVNEKQDVRALFNHDPNLLLGRVSASTLALSVDASGLFYDITPGETTTARDVIAHLQRGDLSGSSFSFRVVKEMFIQSDEFDIREIHDVDLYDVGPVTFPAYEGTNSTVRHEGNLMEVRSSWEQWREQRKTSSAPLPSPSPSPSPNLSIRLANYRRRARIVELEI